MAAAHSPLERIVFSTVVAALCNTSADHHMGRGLRKMDRGGGGHARAASTKERRACAHTQRRPSNGTGSAQNG